MITVEAGAKRLVVVSQSFLTFILLYCSWCCAVWQPYKVSPYIIIVQVIFYFLWLF